MIDCLDSKRLHATHRERVVPYDDDDVVSIKPNNFYRYRVVIFLFHPRG